MDSNIYQIINFLNKIHKDLGLINKFTIITGRIKILITKTWEIKDIWTNKSNSKETIYKTTQCNNKINSFWKKLQYFEYKNIIKLYISIYIV